MFLLDTNVLSELRRRDRTDLRVLAWADSHVGVLMHISAITVFELDYGLLRIARRDPVQSQILREWFEAIVLLGFAGRILSVDTVVARRAAALHVPDPRPDRDALIAATALVHGLTVVTRNTANFAPMGVPTLDPGAWTQAS